MFRAISAVFSCAPILTLLMMGGSPAEARHTALFFGKTNYEKTPDVQNSAAGAHAQVAILPVLRIAREPSFRVAQKRTYKYERPKVSRRAPAKRVAPRIQTRTQKAQPVPPTIRRPPAIRRGGTIRRSPSRRAPKRTRSRRARIGGSCAGCRNSCYVRYRVQSRSRQFVPCMRRCWNQLCRR